MLTDCYRDAKPNIRGVIFIDVWDEPYLDRWVDKMMHNLEKYYLDSVISANYEVALDVRYDTSLLNTISEYSLNNFSPEFILPLMQYTGTREAHRDLQDIVYNKHSFALLTPDAVEYHMQNMVPHVKDWLVVGGAWGACTHCRPFNFYHMSNMDQRFFVADWSMYTENGTTFTPELLKQDQLTWSTTNSKLYQLVPKDVASTLVSST